MNDSTLREILRTRLSENLPGETIQLLMAPDFRRPLSFYQQEIASAKIAAVMILLFRDSNGDLSTVLIKRRESGVHGAQIALPGGKMEESDADLYFTAIRETHEEIGVHPQQIELIGKLSPLYIPPSRFYVTPVVGWLHGEPEFTIAEAEISQITIVPVKTLLDESIKFVDTFHTHTGIPTTAPAYRLELGSMWGATAMIFSEFCEVYRDLH